MSKNAVRMSDIAEKLGISVVTVSKALAGKDGVGESLRQKIEQTAAQMGYRPKNMEGANEKPRTVGILIAHHLIKPEHSFYWALYLSVVECLKEHNYNCMFEPVATEEQKPTLPAFVSNGTVEGVFVLGHMPHDYLQLLEQTALPLVQIDSNCDAKAVCVIPNSYWGISEMTEYLIGKGHRKIGFVGSVDANTHIQDCYYGYLKALAFNKIEVHGEWILPDRNGVEFKRSFDLPAVMPTAFVCCSDQAAYHFVKDLQQKGYRIPADISVTGFYGYIFSTLVSPPLTTYGIDLKNMAEKAVGAQISMIENRSQKRGMYVVCGEIVERDSVLEI